MRAFLVLLSMVVTSNAAAACIKGTAFDLPGELKASVDYLACMQSEQMTQLYEMQLMIIELDRRMINPDHIADIRFRLRMLQDAIEKQAAPTEAAPKEPANEYFWR